MWNNMINNITRLTTRNLGLKLLALVSSALLWLLVVNLDDPTQSRNFTATITVENEDVLTDMGKYYELPNGNTVTFRVTARRSVIESLSGSDFKATADMNKLEDDIRVPVEIEAERLSNQVSISSKTHYLIVRVGEIGDSTFTVGATTTGEPGEGFEVGTVTVNPNVITVEGPSELVSTIDHVSVSVDVSGKIDNFTDTQVPKFYNANGQEIEESSLTISSESVEIVVELLSVHDVKLNVDTKGSLPEGLELDSITTDPKSIKLKGASEVLNSITTVTITDVIDLSEINEDFETTIDISSYLPEGISVAKDTSSQVKISVNVISEASKVFRIRTSNITIRNLSPGLLGDFEDKYVSVVISGLESELSQLKAASVTGSVDASGLSAGTHSVAVTLDLDEGIVARKASTNIVISMLDLPDGVETNLSNTRKNSDSGTTDTDTDTDSDSGIDSDTVDSNNNQSQSGSNSGEDSSSGNTTDNSSRTDSQPEQSGDQSSSNDNTSPEGTNLNTNEGSNTTTTTNGREEGTSSND